MSAGIRIQYARCEPCQFGHHHTPPEAHTWIGREDAEHKGLAWPLTVEQQTANPCACRCAGGPGGCVEITPHGGRLTMPEKLVRDLIPQIIAETGVEPIMRVAGPHEYRALLELKLEEEADEYLRSGDPAELADLVEVARALAAELGEDVDRLAARKLAERGGFGQRLVWCGNRSATPASAGAPKATNEGIDHD